MSIDAKELKEAIDKIKQEELYALSCKQAAFRLGIESVLAENGVTDQAEKQAFYKAAEELCGK